MSLIFLSTIFLSIIIKNNLDIPNPANTGQNNISNDPFGASFDIPLSQSSFSYSIQNPVPTNLIVSGDYLYCTDVVNGINAITITGSGDLGMKYSEMLYGELAPNNHDPSTDHFYHPGLDISGDYAYVAIQGEYGDPSTQMKGLSIVDISTPSNMQEIGYCEISHLLISFLGDVSVYGNYAYIAGDDAGIVQIDISNPSSPGAAAYFDTDFPAQYLIIKDGFLYTTGSEYGELGALSIFNITDPANVTSIATTGLIFNPNDIFIRDNLVYVSSYSSIQVYNVADKTGPSFYGTLYASGGIAQMAGAGDYLYCTAGDGVMALEFTTDPLSPTLNKTQSLKHTALDIAVGGNKAYITLYKIGFAILDISNPSQFSTSSLTLPSGAEKLGKRSVGESFYLDDICSTASGSTSKQETVALWADITVYKIDENTVMIQADFDSFSYQSAPLIWDYTLTISDSKNEILATYHNIQTYSDWKDESIIFSVPSGAKYNFVLSFDYYYSCCNSYTSNWDASTQVNIITCYEWNDISTNKEFNSNYSSAGMGDYLIYIIGGAVGVVAIGGIVVVKKKRGASYNDFGGGFSSSNYSQSSNNYKIKKSKPKEDDFDFPDDSDDFNFSEDSDFPDDSWL